MKCDRCRQETRVTIMSMFNMDTICIPCKELEEGHLGYREAVRAESEAVKNGDLNFPGIGKPKDL